MIFWRRGLALEDLLITVVLVSSGLTRNYLGFNKMALKVPESTYTENPLSTFRSGIVCLGRGWRRSGLLRSLLMVNSFCLKSPDGLCWFPTVHLYDGV